MSCQGEKLFSCVRIPNDYVAVISTRSKSEVSKLLLTLGLPVRTNSDYGSDDIRVISQELDLVVRIVLSQVRQRSTVFCGFLRVED